MAAITPEAHMDHTTTALTRTLQDEDECRADKQQQQQQQCLLPFSWIHARGKTQWQRQVPSSKLAVIVPRFEKQGSLNSGGTFKGTSKEDVMDG